MTVSRFLPAVTVAVAVAFSASAAVAVPVLGNPVNGPATLNTNPGPGNFDVTIGSHAGAQSYAGNGSWSGAAAACTAMGDPAGCGTNQLVPLLNSNWVGNNGAANGSEGASDFTKNGFWVSFADTGVLDQTSNDPVNEVPNGTYTYTFTFTTGDTMAHMGLWIYADDTAEVFISGNGINDDGSLNPNDNDVDGRVQISLDEASGTDDHCGPGADEGIGCQFGEQAFVEVFWLDPNTTYTIEIETLQLSDRAFGLMFAGGLQNVPEPGTLALLGLGVLGLGVARSRRKAA